MKTKDIITWALILYGLFKASGSALAASEDAASLSSQCGITTSLLTTRASPAWVRQLNVGSRPWTIEGEQ